MFRQQTGWMPPKTKAAADRQRAKDRKRREKEAALIAAEHAGAGDPGLARALELSEVEATLEAKGLRLVDVPADGDCLFAAVAQQLKLHAAISSDARSPSAADLRQLAVQHVTEHADDFAGFLDCAVPEYAARLSKPKEVWGGSVEASALAMALGVRISVVTRGSSKPTTFESSSTDASVNELTIVRLEHFMALGAHYCGTRPAANRTSSAAPTPPPAAAEDDVD